MKDDRIETKVQRFLGDQKGSEKEDGKRVRRKKNGKNGGFFILDFLSGGAHQKPFG